MKCTDVPQFTALQMAASRFRKDPKLHLKYLLADAFRCQGLMAVHKTSPAFEGGSSLPSIDNPSFKEVASPFLISRENNDTGTGDEEREAIPRWSNNSGNQRRIILDYSRQHVTGETMELLFDLADRMGLTERMNEMRTGLNINFTERKAVMHHVLRMPKGYDFKALSHHPQGDTILEDVHNCFDRIAKFSDDVREGRIRGCTGKELKNIVCIGIGGSHSGPEAVYEALRGDSAAAQAMEGRGTTLRFVANVDPVDFDLNVRGLNPEETLIIVTSKSFTTAETMQNARTARRWLVRNLCKESESSNLSEAEVIFDHFCAITSAPDEAEKLFGISRDHIFPIWNWVGGRFSVWSAAGILPLSLHYSYDVIKRLLDGAHDIDEHFFDAPLGGNIPVLLGLLGVWNSTFMGYHTRALLPYSHALQKLPSLVQKFDMQSNGKRVTAAGLPLPFHAGEIDFGEAGSIGQHSFYQLLHQGRPVPADFVGFMESQSRIDEVHNSDQKGSSLDGWDAKLEVSGHDELMSNFFAQPDALAYGKTLNDLIQEGVEGEFFIPPSLYVLPQQQPFLLTYHRLSVIEHLRSHKVFPGNRPSSSILMTKLDAYAVGQLLAIYEHRTAVQGFIWGINSFDSFGTEHVNAKRVRAQLSASRRRGASVQGFNSSSGFLLEAYLSHGRTSG
ncbi:hypothetical protein ACHAXR_005423 [Thalassiosira sp. AJA248-18]